MLVTIPTSHVEPDVNFLQTQGCQFQNFSGQFFNHGPSSAFADCDGLNQQYFVSLGQGENRLPFQ